MTSDATRLASAADLIEAEAWAQLQLALPEDFRTRLRIAVHRHDRAVALVTGGSTEFALNRVIGLGVLTPVTPDLLDTLIRQYSRGVQKFLVQMNPEAVTAEIDGWFLERGFVCKPGLGELYRATADAGSLPLARSIRVVEIDQGDAETFEGLVAAPLKVPEEMRLGIRSTIGHERHYMS